MPTDLHCRTTPTPAGDTDALHSLSWERLRADLIAAQSDTPSHAAPRGHLNWNAPPRRALPRRGAGRNDHAGLSSQAAPETEDQRKLVTGRLTVTHVRSRELGLVAADGALGETTREILRQALWEAVEASGPDSQVAVDLRRTEFVDDSAYSALVSAHLRLSGLGRRLFVVLEPGGAGAAWMIDMGLDTLLTRVDAPASLAKLRLPRRDAGRRP